MTEGMYCDLDKNTLMYTLTALGIKGQAKKYTHSCSIRGAREDLLIKFSTDENFNVKGFFNNLKDQKCPVLQMIGSLGVFSFGDINRSDGMIVDLLVYQLASHERSGPNNIKYYHLLGYKGKIEETEDLDTIVDKLLDNAASLVLLADNRITLPDMFNYYSIWPDPIWD